MAGRGGAKKNKGGSRAAKSGESQSPVEQLLGMGVEIDDAGALHLTPQTLNRLRQERIRRATMSRVPSTPQMFQRDGGGLGVAKGQGAFETLTLESLRKVRERSIILKPIHSARHHQVRRMCRRWSGKRTDVGWRVVHKDHVAVTADPPEELAPLIQRVEKLIERPSPRYCKTTADLLVPLEEDLLTINRPVIERLFSAHDPNRVVGLRPVDGAVIWPTLLYTEKWQAEHPRWNGAAPDQSYDGELDEQKLYETLLEVEGFDLWGAEYCLVRDGTLEAVYQSGDLIVAPMNTRTDLRHAGYPPSRVEEAIEIILSFMNVWDYNSSLFTRGMMSEFLLGISGDVHEDDIAGFVDTFREATQGVQRAWRPPIMPLPVDGVLQKIDLKANPKDMAYEVFQSLQISLATAVYRMHPSTVNAKAWDGGSTPSISAPSQATEIALAQEEGLRCDLDHLADSMLTPFAQACHPDLRVVWWYGPDDEQREAEIHSKRAAVSMTRNEIRLEQGLRPMGFWMDPLDVSKLSAKDTDDLSDKEAERLDRYEGNLWNQPADPTFVNQFAMARQEAAQAEQGEQGPPDGFGGEDGAPPPGPDGFGQGQPDYPYGQVPGQDEGPPPPGQDEPESQPPGGPPPGPMQKAVPRRVTVYVEEH